MNNPIKIWGGALRSSGMSDTGRILFKTFKIIGMVLIIAGLQAYGFHRYFSETIADSSRQLDILTNEVATNTRVDSVLNRFADLRRVAGNEVLQDEIVRTYERFIEQFLEDRRSAIEDFSRSVSVLVIQPSSPEAEAYSALIEELELLQDIYHDSYSDLVAAYESPSFLYQPTAIILKRDSALEQLISYNHALYLSLVGDRNGANTVFNEIKESGGDNSFISRVHYAQARMLYDAFIAQSNMEYFQQAIHNTQQSLRYDPSYGLPKLFLEYLLSLQSGLQLENVPTQGDGAGEAEGKRGVISSQPPSF